MQSFAQGFQGPQGAQGGITETFQVYDINDQMVDVGRGYQGFQGLQGAQGGIDVVVNTTYNVATTGNDTTGDGSVGLPWLTLQGAINRIALKGIAPTATVTLQVADGSYAGFTLSHASYLIVLQGNVTTPANVSVTSAITVSYNARLRVQYFYLTGVASSLNSRFNGLIEIGTNFRTASTTGSQITAFYGGRINIVGSYSCSGNCDAHFNIGYSSTVIFNAGLTLTLVGTPAFAFAFTTVDRISCLVLVATFSGTATGTRYVGSANSVIDVGGNATTYLPGNSAGSLSTGAIYI